MERHKHLKKYNDASIHFVTTKTHENIPYFRDEKCCYILIDELEFYRKHYGFQIYGYVIMPDHIHLLLFWDIYEKPDLTISKIIQGIKSHSAKMIIDYLAKTHKPPERCREEEDKPHRRKWTKKIWHEGYYDFNIQEEEKFFEKLEYIHNNPFKCEMIKNPISYPFSSREFYETGNGLLVMDQAI